MKPVIPIDPESLLVPKATALEAARAAAAEYRARTLYPYGFFDNFLPSETLDRARDDPRTLPEAGQMFDCTQEKLKSQSVPECLETHHARLAFSAELQAAPNVFGRDHWDRTSHSQKLFRQRRSSSGRQWRFSECT
jgi:hypothetical protein